LQRHEFLGLGTKPGDQYNFNMTVLALTYPEKETGSASCTVPFPEIFTTISGREHPRMMFLLPILPMAFTR
jgi:hypothetical protein